MGSVCATNVRFIVKNLSDLVESYSGLFSAKPDSGIGVVQVTGSSGKF